MGDLFYLNRGAYDHVGVYLGGDMLIHVTAPTVNGVNSSTTKEIDIGSQLSGKMFQFSSFQGFCGTEENPKY